MTNVFHKIRGKVREEMNLLYLRLSDCAAMCDHCNPELKEICYRIKGSTAENGQQMKIFRARLAR